ncbi:unnamed protein product [Chrysoparadoxa australica]
MGNMAPKSLSRTEEELSSEGEASTGPPPPASMGRFREVYEVGEKLGAGAFSVVHACRHSLTGENFAVKIVDQSELMDEDREALANEVAIMKELSHPHVVELKATFEEGDMIYLVMELVTGGELFSRILRRTAFEEPAARELMRVLVVAVSYLHSHDVVHRDIKPENLLLVDENEDCHIKVADFGFAERISNLENVDSGCGTPQYVAPEILRGQHGTEKVDVWSIGITLFVLLGGYPPFYARDTTLLYEKVTSGEFEFLSPFWDHISRDCKDFIKCTLDLDVGRRYSAAQLLEHRWLKGEEPTQGLGSIKSPCRAQVARRRSLRVCCLAVLAVVKLGRKCRLARPPSLSGVRDADEILSSRQINATLTVNNHTWPHPSPCAMLQRLEMKGKRARSQSQTFITVSTGN